MADVKFKSDDPLIIISEAKQTLAFVAKRLSRLAESFYLTGNDRVSDALGQYSNELIKEIECLTTTESHIIRDQVRLAQLNSQNVLAAALAGVEVGKKGLGYLIAEDARQPVKNELTEHWSGHGAGADD